ncbi:hypothetical protein [Metabacillus fastidiosus]|uniref:Uncharacterized protein n=1 Tax=Metabacillus fastidiosus TaxID=1458 RepID=A0ABU6P1M1_9BACI|nr:hypothetical protein [Metabacillus fastidiosus]
MSEQIKVEFEINAVGEEDLNNYESSFKKHEIVRVKNLSKETTLEDLEETIKALFVEIQSTYVEPPHLTAKVTIRAKVDNKEVKYLG